jgi:GIY-YIG catalytic domain/NUMOD3 motif
MANVNESKKYHFIYKTTNLLSGAYYIGMHSTANLEDGYLGSGTRLRRAIRKHGKEYFQLEILEFVESREKLVEREKELISEELLKDPSCINLKPGGSGGWCNENHQIAATKGANKRRLELLKTDFEFKKRFSQTCSKRNKKQFEEGKRERKYFYDWTGRKHTPETIEKIKAAKRGKGTGSENSQFGSRWITDGSQNKKIKIGDTIPNKWSLGKAKNQ